MNKILKSILAISLALLIVLSAASCAKKTKTQLDLDKFPLVYADENGLQAIAQGEDTPTLITEKFFTFLNAERKVQAASNGKIYYIETENKNTILGDLCAYDVTKKESEVIHSGVYSFKVSHDGECIVFSDGMGGIYRYDQKSEKKDNYVPIQRKGVSSVLDISADGKYVLYTQVFEGTNYYNLTIAQTDFQTTDELDEMSVDERKENSDVSKAPVVIAENYKEYVGASDDLSMVYYSKNEQGKSKTPVLSLNVFKDYKENILLSNKNFTNYYVNNSGEILFSVSKKNAKTIDDVIVDNYAEEDAKLKKANASKKEWNAKVKRDSIRKNIASYLKNTTTTDFYRFDASLDEAELVVEANGQVSQKGVDTEYGIAFFSGTLYNYEGLEKQEIDKIDSAYKIFDSIKSRTFFSVNTKELKVLEAGEDVNYNGGDCFVDTTAKKIHIIMDMDYIKSKDGDLYNVAYTEKGFEEATLVAKKAAKVVHFESGDDNYYVLADNTLVKNEESNAVLKDYISTCSNEKVKMVITGKGTGKKDKYGNEIIKKKTYALGGEEPQEVKTPVADKNIVDKGNMFAYFTSYDFKKASGEMMLFNGEQVVELGKQVSVIYKFGN